MARSTRQRTAIGNAIVQAGRPLSPQEVLLAAQAEVPALGIATVYRNLRSMLEEGDLQQVTLPGEPPRYEAVNSATRGHHHHFQCQKCQRVFDVHHCTDDFSHMAPGGFRVDGHEITLYGVCADCRRAERKD